MRLLRIKGSLNAGPPRCQWAICDAGHAPVQGEGTLADVPRHFSRVQLVLPADEVVLARVNLPRGAKSRGGSLLSFAVEDQVVGEPEAHHTAWLGNAGSADVVAVMYKSALERWRAALKAAGVDHSEVHSEILLLPRAAGEWSLAWGGREGFIRTGDHEGAATDCGSHESPPLTLRLMLEAARKAGALPTAIAAYAMEEASGPDLAAWQRELLVPLRSAGQWSWSTAAPAAGTNLWRQRDGWRLSGDLATRLRPAAWIAACAVVLHALALTADWTVLHSEQRTLRQQMESRFRAAVPDAVAVVDPALQMRRKLAEARHAAGVSDTGDFLPMMEKTALALKELPAGSLRVAAYEQGRLSLELSGIDEPAARRFLLRLLQSGASMDASLMPGRSANGAFIVTVNPS